jgi:probable HAF family extracellular repeat protein
MTSSRKYFLGVAFLAALGFTARMAAQEQEAQRGNTKDKKHLHYRLIDFGTFGGPASYFSEAGLGARVLNNGGTVAGYGDTSTPDTSAPNCFNPDCFLSHTFRWHDGVLTDLGALAGVNTSSASEINALGWIVGLSNVIDPGTGSEHGNAVLWKDHQIINLGTLGGADSNAIVVNDRGQITGFSTNSIPDPFDPFGFPIQLHAFIWENGVMKDLGSLGGPDSFPGAIFNERGQVTGSSYINFIPNPTTGVPTADPFLWEGGHMIDLGSFGGTSGFGLAVNNRGQIIGQSNLPGDSTAHAFLWDRNTLKDLGTLGGTFSSPAWLIDAGEVVGVATVQDDQAFLAFLWKEGVITNLGAVDGDSCSAANSINAKHQVVGISATCDFTVQHAFLWEDGQMIDLNTVVPPKSNLQLVVGFNVNDRGEIVGVGVPFGDPLNTDLFGHLFVLIPCDEDHPNVEGCDYEPIQSAITQIEASPMAATQRKLTPTQAKDRIRALLSNRNRTFRGLQPN